MALVFNWGLLLDIARLEKRILLEPDFVLNDNCRDAKSLKRADEEYKMLGKSARVTVIDDRFGRYFKDVVHRAKTRSDIYRFVVRLALQRGVRERRKPHRIKFVLHLRAVRVCRILRHHCARVLYDKT